MNLILLLVVLAALVLMIRNLILARPALPPDAAQAALLAGDAVLVDVREPAEWQDGVIQSAALLPLSDLRGRRASWQPFLEKHRAKQILLYCHSGSRSNLAASLLRREGFNAANLGGIAALARGGLTVRKP